MSRKDDRVAWPDRIGHGKDVCEERGDVLVAARGGADQRHWACGGWHRDRSDCRFAP